MTSTRAPPLVMQHSITAGPGRRVVADALYSEIREIIRRFACDAICVEVPSETSWELHFFQSQDHRAVNWLLSHSAAPAAVGRTGGATACDASCPASPR